MKVYEMMSELGKLPAGDEIAIPAILRCGGACKGQVMEDGWNHTDPETITWAEIEEIGKAGRAREVFKLGDTKTVTLTTGEKVVLRIIGFDHDDLADGSGKAPISWDMVGVLDDDHSMNVKPTNKGGWADCDMRAFLSNDLFEKLPDDLKEVIKPVFKLTGVGGESEELAKTSDKLWILSEREQYGRSFYSAPGEGKWYEFYRQEDAPWDRRYKNGEGDRAWYFLRSPYLGASAGFCVVNSDGARNYGSASYSYGVAVGFCI